MSPLIVRIQPIPYTEIGMKIVSLFHNIYVHFKSTNVERSHILRYALSQIYANTEDNDDKMVGLTNLLLHKFVTMLKYLKVLCCFCQEKGKLTFD